MSDCFTLTLKSNTKKNLVLEFPTECITALVCPSESKKAEIFELIAGIKALDKNEIHFQGRSITKRSPQLLKQIGFVPEKIEVISDRTVQQMAQFLAHLYSSWDWDYFESSLQRFSLKPDQLIHELSLAQLRLLWFVYTTTYNPSVLLLQNPTQDLDPLAWRILRTEILDFMERPNKTLIFTDENLREIQRLADFIVFMHDDTILGHFEKDSLFDQWKTLWLNKKPPQNVSGIISASMSEPYQIVTSSFAQTQATLNDLGIQILSSGSLSLEEIYIYLSKTGG